MLRHLYKTLIISIMCGSLSIMNMTAFAQEAGTTSSSSNMTKAKPNNAVTRDANGVYKKTESHDFKGTKGSEDNALNIITMLAVGVIGTKLLMYKKWTMDMSVVAAASAAYIIAEIMNIMNLKKQISDMHVDLTKSSDGKIDQAQIETLQKLRESYEKVKSSVKTRKMLQMGAAAIFAGATAVAAYQRLTEEGQLASCEAAMLQAQTELTTCLSSSTIAPSEATACTKAQGEVTTLQGLVPKIKVGSEKISPSLATEWLVEPMQKTAETVTASPGVGGFAAHAKGLVQTACSTYYATKTMNKAVGNPIQAVSGMEKQNVLEKQLYSQMSSPTLIIPKSKTLAEKFLDGIFPRAEAGMLSMLGLGAGAAAAFFSAQTAIGRKIDMYMYTPGGRIIAWGIMTGAALLGAQASQSEIDKIDENLKKIDKILADLNALQKGVKANTFNEQQLKMAGFNGNFSTDLELNPNANVKTDCLSNGSNGSCASLESQLKEMPGFAGLPDSFKSIASQSAKIGDGLSGTNGVGGSTLSGISNMAGKQNAISKLANNVKSKLNDQLAKNGKGKIDFDKEEKKLMGDLKNDVSKALRGKNMSGGEFLASSGMSGMADSHAKAVAATASVKKSLSSGFGSGAGASAPPAGNKDKEFSLDFKEEGVAEAGFVAAGDANSPAAEAQYDVGQNDINTNSNESIFQMISNRYIKSGYPKLLEEEPVKN